MAEQQIVIGGHPFNALSGVTAVGAGGAMIYASGARCKFGVNTTVTGAPTSFNVNLEGTLDGGATWFTLQAVTAAGYTAVVDKPVNGVRANLTSLVGGTAPTVTVQITAV